MITDVIPGRVVDLRSRGFRIGYAEFARDATRPVLLLPTWPAIPIRHWKMQLPFLASRGFRVVAYDSAGNGMGERTLDLRAYEYDRIVDQGIDVLDHAGIARADVIGYSRGATYGLSMAARYADRVRSLILIGNAADPARDVWITTSEQESYDGTFVREHYREHLERFYAQAIPEEGSGSLRAEAIAWGLDTAADIIARASNDPALFPRLPPADMIARVHCPTLILHGDRDPVADPDISRRLAAAIPGSRLLILEGSGHMPHLTDPERVNAEILRFLGEPTAEGPP